MMVANEARIVNDLHEEIMDQLRTEPVGVQIKVAFGVLFAVLNHSMRNEPDDTKRAVAQLQQIFNSLQ
jgi:hypothetical protein